MPVARVRPSVFVGSSSEGISIARAVQFNLDKACEVEIWGQGVFGLTQGTLESLVLALERFDFAVLALTADDLTVSRGLSDRQRVTMSCSSLVFSLVGSAGSVHSCCMIERIRQRFQRTLQGLYQHPCHQPQSSADCFSISQCSPRTG